MSETITFIGAGPGEPDLMTIRGARLLRHADRVFCTDLSWCERILSQHRSRGNLVDISMMKTNEALSQVLTSTLADEQCVILSPGTLDSPQFPLVLHQALCKHGITCVLVPGIGDTKLPTYTGDLPEPTLLA